MESIRKILIVDDDTLFLNLLAQALRERGHMLQQLLAFRKPGMLFWQMIFLWYVLTFGWLMGQALNYLII